MIWNIFKKKAKKEENSFWPPIYKDDHQDREIVSNGLMSHLSEKEAYIKLPEGYTYKPISRFQRGKFWLIRLFNKIHLCR